MAKRGLRAFVPAHKAPCSRLFPDLSGVLVNYNSPDRSIAQK